MHGHGVEPLEAKDQLVEEQPRLFMEAANESVPLVESQQDIHAPLKLRIPNVQAGHAARENIFCVNIL